MNEAEKLARIAELEHEYTLLALTCQRLQDELHDKRNRLQAITLRITQLRRDIPDEADS